MIEKNNLLDWRANIALIGAPTPVIKAFLPITNSIQLSRTDGESIPNNVPICIESHNGLLAIIDQKNNLWIVGNSFSEPVNLSDVVRMKAKQVFLGEGQLIFQNRKHGWILISWGGKVEIGMDKMRKLHINHNLWNNIFQAYFFQQEVEQGTIWYYSTVKKVENTIKLYHINAATSTIIGLPILKVIQLPEKIMGMSLGKYHGLCWTISGRVFSWGCKNLALGLKKYEKSYYDLAMEITMHEPILKAYAGLNYSIALGISGNLYEWGIKSSGNTVLVPHLLPAKQLKFIDIKGYDNLIAGLASNNNLYIWGKGAERITNIPDGWDCDTPLMINKQKGVKIYEYSLEQSCIIAIIGKDTGLLSRQEQQYFSEVVRKVSTKYLPHRLKQKRQTKIHHKSHIQAPKQSDKFIEPVKKNEDYIDRLIYQHTNKQDYFSLVQNQEVLFKQIMTEKSVQRQIESRKSVKQNINNYFKSTAKDNFVKTHRKVESARQTPVLAYDISNCNKIIRQFQADRAFMKNNGRKLVISSHHRRQNINYQERRDAVLQKKIQIQEKKRECRMKTIQKKSLTMIQKRKNQEQQIMFDENKKNYSKISSFIKKSFLVHLLMSPLQLGREIKIKQFMENLSFNKISNNMKNILHKNRAIALLKTLEQNEPKKYQLVRKIFTKFILTWKKKKYSKNRQLIINRFIVKNLAQKMQNGLGKIWLITRKIQKVVKWMQIQQKQRTLQLKLLWKKSLLLYLKPTPSFQNKKPSACREQMNLKITTDKFKTLKLHNFLAQSPIFNLRLKEKYSISFLQKNYEQALCFPINLAFAKENNNKRGVSWAINQVFQYSLNTTMHDCQRKTLTNSTGCNVNLVDILMYSQHYDYFYKPKNYQINIPDCMKQSQRWITEEIKIFNKIIKQILYVQWREFCKERRDYEFKLAVFIKQNYQILSEHRWKFILQYNKIKDQSSIWIVKRQRQLKKLLESIGAQHLLKNDVIPQKHKIMEYVQLIKGSPVAPTLQIKFTQQQFKKQFKNYYENVSNKAKFMRKFYN